MSFFTSNGSARQLVLAGAALVCALWSPVACAAEAAGASAEPASAGLVHCLLPGQVRRLGAFSTSVSSRRAVRVTPAQCRTAGGEYVEPQDQSGAVKMWLPMANEGIPEAQTIVGELFDQRGDKAMARSWYEKAAAQGDARAVISLAGLIGQAGTTVGSPWLSSLDSFNRVSDLMRKATGGLVAGLAVQRTDRLRIDFVSPVGATPVPRPTNGPVVLEAPAGPLEVVVRVAGSAALRSVRVNGETRSVDAQGLLSIPVTVNDSRSSLVVQAEDETGDQAKAELSLVQRSAPLTSAGSSMAPPALVSSGDAKATTPPLLPGRRFALVIANQQYKHWEKLDTPQADAQAVASVLKQRFGFEVTLAQDVTRQQLLAALSRLRQKVGPQDQVVVYYAGHGQMDDVTARGYWIPVDGDQKDIAQWVSVIDVTDQLSAMTARHVLVIADSCYSGTLTRSLVPVVDHALTAEQRLAPLRQLSKQRARVAMTSGGLEPVVDGGSIEHSLFARSLLDVLGQVNGPVAAQELHNAVAARFAHLARRLKVKQQPQYSPIGFAGHEAGDFVFSPM